MKIDFPRLHIKPQSMLFCCTMNSIRSPMAENYLKKLAGDRIFVDSAGIFEGETDYLMLEVMGEVGIDCTRHRAKLIEELNNGYFDLIITLSDRVKNKVEELTRNNDSKLIYWPVADPSWNDGNRDEKLLAYRMSRDAIFGYIDQTISFYDL